MKVLDLQCAQLHRFEAWFGSEADFQSQLGRGLVECPLCGDAQVNKVPTAARLNLGKTPRREATGQVADEPLDAVALTPEAARMQAALQAAWTSAVNEVLANTEDVGERFPEEARRIHYGETEERGIRGQASAQERAALLEEGITIAQLPLPKGFKGKLQ